MKRSLLHIIVSNILYLFLVAGNNFLLPRFTSVETYAAVKEYTLYITTYSTILTVGYTQGMYLKYGGKEISKLNSTDIGNNIVSFFFFMLPLSIVISLYGLSLNNLLLSMLGAGFLATNIENMYQTFYQATGEFKLYGIALNAARFLTLVINLFLIFVNRTDNPLLYVGVVPLIDISVVIYLTIVLNNKIHFLKSARFSLQIVKGNIKNGFILMLGDFVTKFFTSIDKWFIKYLMNTFCFAMYSFAVSMENLVNTFMTPVTVSMYNFFCKRPSIKRIRQLKELSIIYSLIVIAGAFPCKWILEHFIQNYISAATIMFLLFAAQGLSTIIRGIYVNKYKAEGRQTKYFRQMIAILGLSIVLNAIFYFIVNSMIAIAAATLVTNIVWLITCEIQNPELRFNFKTAICIIICLSVYIITGYLMDPIEGCILYCIAGLVCFLVFMRTSFMYLVKSISKAIVSKLQFF